MSGARSGPARERYDGLRLLVFALSAACFVSTLAGVLLWSGFGILPAYLATLLAGLTAVTGAAFFAGAETRKSYLTPDLALGAALFALAAALRFRHLGDIPLWSDEDLQNWFVLRRVNIVYMAAFGQQPPLHHFLALATMKWFGVSLFGLRFFTALFGSLAVPVFYFLLLRIGCRRALALGGAAVFLTNNWMVSYSQEAKPYMMAVFFAVVVLAALADFLRAPAGWRPSVTLAAAAVLFLHTVGVQPLLFFFLCVAPAALVLWRRAERKKLLYLAGAVAVGFGAFVPDLYAIRLLSAAKGYIRPLPGIAAYLSGLRAGFPGFLEEMRLLLEGNAWLYALVALGGAAALLRGNRRAPELGAALGAAGAVVFPLAVYAFFRLFVTLQIMHYYLILLWPLLFLAAACAAETLAARLGGAASRLATAAAVAGAAAICVAEVRKPSVKIAEANIPWVYRYWREQTEEKALAFYFTANESPPSPEISSQVGFIGTDYYYTPDVARKVSLSSAWDRQLTYAAQMSAVFDEIENPTEPRAFYFFAFHRENEFDYASVRFTDALRARVVRSPDPRYGDWAAATLLRIDNPYGSRRTLARFFADLAERSPRPSLNLKPYLALAAIAVEEGRCEAAEGYFRKIRALCTGNFTDCRAEPRLRKNYGRACSAGRGQKDRLW